MSRYTAKMSRFREITRDALKSIKKCQLKKRKRAISIQTSAAFRAHFEYRSTGSCTACLHLPTLPDCGDHSLVDLVEHVVDPAKDRLLVGWNRRLSVEHPNIRHLTDIRQCLSVGMGTRTTTQLLEQQQQTVAECKQQQQALA